MVSSTVHLKTVEDNLNQALFILKSFDKANKYKSGYD